ncbi:hypothetical protein Tco_0375134 [Tanacetum coccineum]
MMRNDKSKQSKSYQIFLKYSTSLIPPKKSRDKGSQGKKTVDVSPELVDVFDESKPEPTKKKTGSRSTRGVVIQDTPSAPKPKTAALKLKLKGVQSLTLEEQEAADAMQALKESKKTSRRQSGTEGSSEGTGRIPGVPDESTIISATSSEGTGTKPGVPAEKNITPEENVILECGSKHDSKHSEDSQLMSNEEEKKDNDGDADDEDEDNDDISDIQDTNDEDAEIESDEDEIYKYKIQVHKDVDVEMVGAITVERENKEKDEMTDAAKADVEKTTEEKGDAELDGNLSVISETTTLPPIPEIPTETLISTTLSLPHATPTILIMQQTKTLIHTPPIITEAPTITTVVPESDALSAVQLRVVKLEKDMSELKKIDHSAETLATLKSQVPTVIDNYLGSKFGDVLQKELQKHTADLIQKYYVKPTPESSKIQTPKINLEQELEKSALEIRKIKKEQAEKQKMPKYTIKSTDKETLKEYDQKSSLYQTINENKQHDDDKDDDEDPSAGPNQGKKTKRRRTKESESSMKPSTTKETSKGKALSKSSKTGKSATIKKLVEEPIVEVVMDNLETNANEDVVNDANRPQDDVAPKTDKLSRDTWFKQPPRPLTPDPEWNKRQVVTDQPEQPWFNSMVSVAKDPLTFDELMATTIDFSKFAMNRLKLDHLTQEILVGPVYNLLKGTCTSSIELGYNMEECFKALTYILDWNNPEGDFCPFDLTKPLPLKGRPGHLTVAAEYFFNNDLEFLKSSDLEKKYTTSITKTKAAWYEIVGIEYMVPTLWSTIKYGYDKDAEKGIKHWGYRRKLCVKKLHGYGHLEEIVVKRVDRHLYKFKEDDFVDLQLNDIEDMLLLTVQHKYFHLDGMTLLTLLWLFADELYRFFVGTLKTIRDELHHRILDFCLGYNKEMSRRKWMAIDKRTKAARVSVKKLHGYGHLEEIMVKRAYQRLYKFKEGNFVDLHLNDIEDMLLLDVQHKLFNLNDSDIVDFIVALYMFTRSLIIKRRVKDLQLGVESYQKKLNITAPQKTFPEIEFKELYTP